MGLQNKIAQYREYRNGVSHCTFSPEGPGVVRIHLIPPKFRLLRSSAYIVILNGYYLLPIGYSWALLLSSFMEEVNKFDGKPITDSMSPTIDSYSKYEDGDYVSLQLDFKIPYIDGEIVNFSFKINQKDMLCRNDRGYFYEFVPGWFNSIQVKNYRFT